MIFYLSSQGHAATKWITDAFSLHPDVIAFHGIRSMPPVTIFEELCHFGVQLHKLSGNSKEVAVNLAHGLQQCAKHSGRVFGAAHTIWGLHCKGPFENLGGKFGGIIRHPIMQFHSMMNAYTPRALSHNTLPVDFSVEYSYLDIVKLNPKLISVMIKSKDISFKNAPFSIKLNKIRWKIDGHADLKKMQKEYFNPESKTLSSLRRNRSDEAILDLLAARFRLNLNRVFDDHWEFIYHLVPENVIIMEKVTTDFDYFKKKFKTFTGLDYPEKNKEKIFKLNHGHRHTKNKTIPKEVWNSWPAEIQEIFRKKLFSNNDLIDFYKKHDYWLPE